MSLVTVRYVLIAVCGLWVLGSANWPEKRPPTPPTIRREAIPGNKPGKPGPRPASENLRPPVTTTRDTHRNHHGKTLSELRIQIDAGRELELGTGAPLANEVGEIRAPKVARSARTQAFIHGLQTANGGSSG